MYHIVPGAYFSEGLRDGTWLPTLAQEQELQMRVTSDGYTRMLKYLKYIRIGEIGV